MNSGFDMRPFLYPSRFPFQFNKIDQLAAKLPNRSNHPTGGKAKQE
jgi:NAD+ synthase (glutamine-hydrolysing)